MKTSAERLQMLETGKFDAAIMVNVLYAVEDPQACLREVARILKPDGVLAFSTTHRDTILDPLLDRIKQVLEEKDLFGRLGDDYVRLRKINKGLEARVAKRYTREQYADWVRTAGFEIVDQVPSTYAGAVMVIHARKKG